MTSEQVLLITAVLAMALGGCQSRSGAADDAMLNAPHRVWAVAPLRNESGSLYAGGLNLADQVASQLQLVGGIDVLPVNRTLAAMDAADMPGGPSSPAEARQLIRLLDADGLVVGSITAYDPYDPPKLGVTMELFVVDETGRQPVDLRGLVGASTADAAAARPSFNLDKPAAAVSAYFDAADPAVRESLENYAAERGKREQRVSTVRLHRINMDLFSRFVSHEMSRRLVRAEMSRPIPPVASATAR